jgi:L-fuculose-phosphate aldolase
MHRFERLELIAAGARLAAAGLVSHRDGNLSLRLDPEHCLITPTAVDTGQLRAPDLVVLPLADPVSEQRASTESRMHAAVYRRFAAVEAVVHAHPPAVQCLATTNRTPDCGLLVEGGELIGGVGWVGRLEPGSAALAEAVVEALSWWPACVLDGHGALTIGVSIHEALRRMMLLERLARMTEAASRP